MKKKQNYVVPEMESVSVEMQGTIATSGVVVGDYPEIWGEEEVWDN